jgi:RimJ/RimL family protein N-acetyltransferase
VADAPTITFRLLTRADLPALTRWLNTPHVYAWWGEISGPGWLGGPGDTAATLEMVTASYAAAVDGTATTEHLVIELEQRPIGMMQWYRLSDEPDYSAAIDEPAVGSAGVDLLIGEVDAIGRGIGPAVIDAFVRTVMFATPDVRRAVASPDVRNRRSIRAFERAGFRALRDALVADGHHFERVMVRDRSERPGPPGR